MHIAIDIILACVLLFTTIRYFKMGFVKALFSICKFALSLLLAFSLASTVGAVISEKAVYNTVYESVHSKVEAVAGDLNEGLDMSDVVDKLPESMIELIADSDEDVDALKSELGEEKINNESIVSLSKNISTRISTLISNVLAFILIFVISMIVLGIVAFILDKVCELPGLRQVNKLLGLALGALCGILGVIIACAVITALLSIMPSANSPGMTVEAMNEKTVIYSFVNNSGLSSWIFDLLGRM